jgi:hypothetical protein
VSTGAGRFVVVVPDVAEPGLLASRIHGPAAAADRAVLLFGVASDHISEIELRQKLTLVAGFLENAGTRAEIQIETNSSWSAALQAGLGESDSLACSVDDSLAAAGDRWIDDLGSRFGRSVHAFVDIRRTDEAASSVWSQVLPWAGSLIVILGFVWLQVRLDQLPSPVNTIAQLISLPIEVGLILVCNSALG